MNLWIWREKYNRAKDELCIWIAAALPRRVAYYATMRLVCHATTGKYSDTVVPELGVMECLNRWDKDKLKQKRSMVGFDKDTMLPVRIAEALDQTDYQRDDIGRAIKDGKVICDGCHKTVNDLSLSECDKCLKWFCDDCICTPDQAPVPLCLGCIKAEVSIPVNEIETGEDDERIGMSDNHRKLEDVAGKRIPTGAEVARALKKREE